LLKNTLVTCSLIQLYIALWKGSAIFEYAPYTSLWFAPAGFSVAILMLWVSANKSTYYPVTTSW